MPLILREIIPRLTEFMRPEFAYILIILSTLNIVAILFNSAMVFIYLSKIPFFEQYRNNPDVAILISRNLGLGKQTQKRGIN